MTQRHEPGRAPLRVALLAAAGMVAYGSAAQARTGACEPVRIGHGASALEGAWREALDALVIATAREGMPWSCSGGTVDLDLEASGGAVLTVIDVTGRAASRRVSGPQEVVATGEALLASPLVEAAPPAPERAPQVEPAPPPLSPPAGPADPRLQIQVLVGPRVSGPDAMAWGSGYFRLQMPFGPWSAAVWGRYEVHLAGPDHAPTNFKTSAFSVGLGAGRRIISKPFELRATFDPSVAVVIMESGYENQPHPEGAKPALRLGTSLSALFPIAGVFRGVVAIDGEFAPAGFTGIHNIDTNPMPQLPPVPWYTAGILLGVEAHVR